MKNLVGAVVVLLLGGFGAFTSAKGLYRQRMQAHTCAQTEAGGRECCAVCGAPAEQEVELSSTMMRTGPTLSSDTFAVCAAHAALPAEELSSAYHEIAGGASQYLCLGVGVVLLGVGLSGVRQYGPGAMKGQA